MIKVIDATRLAVTKLRTRKVRLFVTIIVSGLLLSALSGASMIVRGAFASFESFSKEGLGERFIIESFPHSAGDFTTNEEVLDRAVVLHNELVKKKKVEAKRLGIVYEAAADASPVEEFDTPGGKFRNLRFDHPSAEQAVMEYIEKHPVAGIPQLQEIAQPYSPKTFYTSKMLSYGPTMPSMKILENNEESYENEPFDFGPLPVGTDSFTQGWSLLSQGLLQPFLLTADAKVVANSVPVVAPYTATEQLLQLQALPPTAPTEDKLARLKELRERAASITFQVCYRNTESENLLNQAIAVQQELDKNKNNKDYIKPLLIYGLPKKPCGPVPISSDKRTASEKKLADKQAEFNKIFGEQEPMQQIINFNVIGIAPDSPGQNSSVVSSLIASLVSSHLGNGSGWYTPLEPAEEHTLVQSIFNSDNVGSQYKANYVEFNTANDATQFIDDKSCQPDFTNFAAEPGMENPFQECIDQGKPFGLQPYGSNSLALDGAKEWFGKIFNIAALVVAIVATIIMVGTVGRTLADSRRETAVFRAIGAKKLDITQIYIIYTIFLALLIVGFAITVGFLLSQFVHNRYSDEFTVQALVAYNAQDLGKTFKLYDFYALDLIRLAILTLLAGLLSASLPLIRNLRRNPIKDMRDDT